MTQLIAEMKRTERSWSEVDAQLYNALRSIGTSLPGPGLLRDIGFQIGREVPSLQRRLDLIVSTQKIGLDKGVVWADETLWASSSPAGGAAAAKSAAEQLRQARKDADGVKGQKVISPETLKLLEKHQHDPYFAVALAKEIPPAELKAILGDLYDSVRNPLDERRPGPPSDKLEHLTKLLSVTLGTASRGVGNMRLPKGYADELIRHTDGIAGLEDAIVGKLLQHGAFDDAFLLDLANKVYDNARKPTSERQNMLAFGPGLATALANNPRVAQDFFTDPARKPLAFLIRQTYWGDRGAALGKAIEAASTTYRDHGQPPGTSRGYKSALIASWAVHFWSDEKVQRSLPETRQSFARIVSDYMSDVHRVANSDILETPGVVTLPDTDPNLSGHQDHAARFHREELKSVLIWAAKEPDAFKTVVESNGEYSFRVLNARGSEVANEIKAEFATWQKQNPNATEAEQSAYRQKLIKDTMSGNPGDFFNAKVTALSKSLYFLVDSANMASINEADRKDQWEKAFTDGIKRTTKLALTPAGDGVNAVYDFVEAYVSDNQEPTRGEKARDEAADKLTQSQNLFKFLTANVMLRHGLFGDENAPGSSHPHAFENSAKRSTGNFLIDGRIKPPDQMDADEAYAYDEWLKHSTAAGIFNNTAQAVHDGFKLPSSRYEAAKP
ncbi:hypothetical protein AB0C27_34010 [Nonomuraea sp. NPDC048882]|uniref:hypothetical protein n=1 Tax=Nonomuraea sp. NPDC048882 TaxID=3154347 RepID=UPI0033C3DFF8